MPASLVQAEQNRFLSHSLCPSCQQKLFFLTLSTHSFYIQAFLSGNGITKEQLAEQPEVLKEFIVSAHASEHRHALMQICACDTQINVLSACHTSCTHSLTHLLCIPVSDHDCNTTNITLK